MIQAVPQAPRLSQTYRATTTFGATPPLSSLERRRTGTDSVELPTPIPFPDVAPKRQRQAKTLHAIRERIEELILLNNRQLCQELVGGLSAADITNYRLESKRLIADIRTIVGAKPAQSTAANLEKLAAGTSLAKGESSQVRVRLSKGVTRILQAFGNSGKRPGELIERALWKDPAIRDAALLLRIDPPDRRQLTGAS